MILSFILLLARNPKILLLSKVPFVIINKDFAPLIIRYLRKDRISGKTKGSPPTMVNDYLIPATVASLKTTLATFDNELRKIAKRRGIDVKP